MRWAWKIGRVAGIDVFMHATFLLLILFIFFLEWNSGHNLNKALSGIAFILALFVCIVVHEFGHALTARRYGIRTRDIVLLPIGGVARLERMPDDPMQEFRVALAGPIVSVLIGAVLLLIQSSLGHWPGWRGLWAAGWTGGPFLTRLALLNWWLAAFNVLPAFPMDGGRVLRALLATRMEYTRATQAAAHLGQTIALLFGLIGLFTDPFLLFIALFVWIGAEQESAMVQMRTSLGGIPVQAVMLTDFRSLQPDDTLAQAVEHTLAGWQQDFPVVFGDKVLGVLTREDLVRALAERGSEVHIRDAMKRDFQWVDSHDMLEKALTVLRECRCRSLPVEHDGRLVGMLTTDHVAEFLMIQSALRRQSKRPGKLSPSESL